jgi:hypothetical protein
VGSDAHILINWSNLAHSNFLCDTKEVERNRCASVRCVGECVHFMITTPSQYWCGLPPFGVGRRPLLFGRLDLSTSATPPHTKSLVSITLHLSSIINIKVRIKVKKMEKEKNSFVKDRSRASEK